MCTTSADMSGEGLAWFIYGSSRAGFAPTLDEAKAKWKAVYMRRAGPATSSQALAGEHRQG
jgi:hypothetical protein